MLYVVFSETLILVLLFLLVQSDLCQELLEQNNAAEKLLEEQLCRSRKSMNAVSELLDSEREYASRLEDLRQSVAKPAKTILSRSEFASLFGNLDAVCTLAWTFLSELNHEVACFVESSSPAENPGVVATIEIITASLFIRWTQPFKILAQYIVNYDAALLTLGNMQQRARHVRRYAQFWKVVARFCSNIEAHLILPVQRLPRYVLLLSEMIAVCNDPTSLEALDQARESIREVTFYCNEDLKKLQRGSEKAN